MAFIGWGYRTAVMRAKGAAMDDVAFKEIVTERVLGILRCLVKRRDVVKSGASRNARWAVVQSLF